MAIEQKHHKPRANSARASSALVRSQQLAACENDDQQQQIERFKAELFRKLEHSGVLDSIKVWCDGVVIAHNTSCRPRCRHHITSSPQTNKAHLRAQLLSRLCTPGAPSTPPLPQPSFKSLTTDLLVAEYLCKRQYHYALSVFQPEAGLAAGVCLLLRA